MLLQDFIKSNDNWEEILTKDPYNIRVTRDNGYVMFKYNQLSSDFTIPLVREARGCVLREDDWACVCVPFYKFGNYAESYVEELDWTNGVSVQTKIDGSLCKLWHDKGQWHLSTNGTIDARKASVNEFMTFYDLFEKALKTYGFESLEDFVNINYMSKRNTYMFELATCENRVVIPYEGYHIFFLGARSMIDNVEWKLEDNVAYFGVERPRCYTMETLEDVIEVAEKLPWDEEGYVCVDTHFNRCKVKSPAYVMAHYSRNNGVITTRRLIHVILANEVSEFCTYCGDYRENILYIKSKMEKVEELCLRAGKKFGNSASKAELAQAIKDLPAIVKGYCFKAYGHDLTFKEFSKDWTSREWERAINGIN